MAMTLIKTFPLSDAQSLSDIVKTDSGEVVPSDTAENTLWNC